MEAFNGAGNQQPYPDFAGSALEGLNLGQQARAVSALRGIDINNPDSLNAGIGNLVRAGAADQASALMGLQLKRSALEMAPKLLDRLNALGQQQGQSQNAGAADLHGEIAQDARTFGQTPPDQQPALAASLKQKYLGKGFSEGAIDSALAHAANGGADQLAATHDAHASLLNGGSPDPATLDHGGDYGWAKGLLGDVGLQAGLDWVKQYGGPDFTGRINTAHEIMAPEISAEATARNAQATSRETELGKLAVLPQTEAIKADMTPPVAGATPVFDVNHNHVGWRMADGAIQSISSAAAAQSGGAVAGAAPGHPIEMPLPGGKTQPATFEQDGKGNWAYHPAKVVSADGTTTTAPTSSPGEIIARNKSSEQFQSDQQLVGGSNNRLAILKHVNDLLSSPQGGTGPGTQAVNGWRSFLLAQAPGLLPGGVDQAKIKTATQDELHKYMVQLAGNAAAQYGPGTNEKLAMAASGNANPEISTLANRDVTRMNIALERANQARLDAFGKTGASPDNYSDFTSKWGRSVDPRAFMLDLLTPTERHAMLGTITSAADRRALVAGKLAAEKAGIYSESDIKR